MTANPKPIPAPRIANPDDVPGVRRVACRRYNGCLETADREGWSGFACSACEAYQAPTFEELREECGRFARLISHVPNAPWGEVVAGARIAQRAAARRAAGWARRAKRGGAGRGT